MMILHYFLELASLFFGCVLVQKSWPAPYRLLVVFKCVEFSIAVLSMLWSSLMRQSNHWIYNLYNPVECIFLLYIFYRAAMHGVIKRLNLILLATVLPLILAGYVLSPNFFSLNIIGSAGCFLLLLLSSCGAYVDLLLDKGDLPLFRHPLFWLAGGVLMYGICMVLYYITWEYSKKMILYRFFFIDYFGGLCLLNLGIIGCFVFVYRQWAQIARSGTFEQ
ncbi:MAG TPA: hypothetical protein VF939_09525 [Puia sp.]